jgi:hypothetical protein
MFETAQRDSRPPPPPIFHVVAFCRPRFQSGEISELVGGEWSASRHSSFTPPPLGERAPSWVDLRSGLNSNSEHSVVQPVTLSRLLCLTSRPKYITYFVPCKYCGRYAWTLAKLLLLLRQCVHGFRMIVVVSSDCYADVLCFLCGTNWILGFEVTC